MTPLIYTTHGNLPVEDLRQEITWRVEPDQIHFIETYYLGDEVVKQSAHVKFLTGASADATASI